MKEKTLPEEVSSATDAKVWSERCVDGGEKKFHLSYFAHGNRIVYHIFGGSSVGMDGGRKRKKSTREITVIFSVRIPKLFRGIIVITRKHAVRPSIGVAVVRYADTLKWCTLIIVYVCTRVWDVTDRWVFESNSYSITFETNQTPK